MFTSIFLAKALGIYLVFLSVAFIFCEARLKALILDMLNKPAAMLMGGFVALIIGILLVVSHNVWVADWRVLVTIIGWMALLKGATIILFPDFMIKMSMKWVENKTLYYITFLFTFIVGLILLYYGFRG